MRIPDQEYATLLVRMVADALSESVSPILLKNPDATGEGSIGIGTALVLDVAGRFIAVTAAHVITPEVKVVHGLLPRGTSTIKDVTWLSGGRAFGLGGGDFDPTDVAIMELSEDQVRRWGVTPVPLDRVLVRPLWPHEFVIVHGHPYELAKFEFGSPRSASAAITFATLAVPQELWDKRLKPEVHQVIYWPDQDVLDFDGVGTRVGRLPDPKGISGAGVWVIDEVEGRVASRRDLRLVGIEYAHLDGHLWCNNMEVVLYAIVGAFPELKEVIERAPIWANGER